MKFITNDYILEPNNITNNFIYLIFLSYPVLGTGYWPVPFSIMIVKKGANALVVNTLSNH